MDWKEKLKRVLDRPEVPNPFISEDPVAKKNQEILKAKQEEKQIKRTIEIHAVQVKAYKNCYVLDRGKLLIYRGMMYDKDTHHAHVIFLAGEDLSKGMATTYSFNFKPGPHTLETFLENWTARIKKARLEFIELHQQMKDLGLEVTAQFPKYTL